MAFLRVELHTEDISSFDRRRKTDPVTRLSQQIGRIVQLKMIRMREIKFRTLINTIQQSAGLSPSDLVPTHVRYLVPAIIRNIESYCPSIEPTQPGRFSLFARLRHQLHSKANSKNWFFFFQ